MRSLFAVIIAATVLSGCGASVFDLEEGTCFDDEDATAEEVSSVPVVDCDEPHDNEVYANVDVTGYTDFPGASVIEEAAIDECLAAFEPYVGLDYESSALEIGWLFPTAQSWDNNDDRTITCFLYNVDLTKLTGSMQGAAR